ncbi:MAG TPA: PAS domain S-box protein, partial [Deltaproteobacteria bacterium]|nr:PAS domain S-box protein [Deltaproteobacteria bacterium]
MTTAKSYHGRISKGRNLRILKAAVFTQIVFFVLLVWIDEVLDLPHVLLGSPAIPANWTEAAIESAYALAAGILVYLVLAVIKKRSPGDEQKIQRQKVISDILMYDSPTLFLAVNPDASILMASRSLLDKLGYTLEEVVGKKYPSMFVPEREREGALRTIAQLSESGAPTRNERHLVSRHGKEYLVQWESRVAYLENGEIDFLYAAGIDITEQKEAETALKFSEERYRSFVQNFQGIAYQGTLDFVTIFFHGAVEQITGYSEQDFLSGSPGWDEIIHPDDAQAFRESAGLIRSIPNYTIERTYRIVRKDGQVRWVREYIQNMCGSTGRPTAVQGIIYDVTSVKEAEESLRKSNERYRLLAENVIDVIWAIDKDFHYTYISPSVEKMRGYSVEEAMNLPLDKMFTEKSYRQMMEIFAQETARYEKGEIAEPGRSATFEAELIRKDGSTMWAEVTASYVFDSDGRPSGYVG